MSAQQQALSSEHSALTSSSAALEHRFAELARTHAKSEEVLGVLKGKLQEASSTVAHASREVLCVSVFVLLLSECQYLYFCTSKASKVRRLRLLTRRERSSASASASACVRVSVCVCVCVWLYISTRATRQSQFPMPSASIVY